MSLTEDDKQWFQSQLSDMEKRLIEGIESFGQKLTAAFAERTNLMSRNTSDQFETILKRIADLDARVQKLERKSEGGEGGAGKE